MQRIKINSKIEQQIITAMIVSKEFLSQAVPVMDLKFIRAEHLRIVARWCIRYFEKYRKAPCQHIQDQYYRWSEKGNAKEEVVQAVHDLLEQLSDNYDETQFNVPYLIDLLGEFLTFQKLEIVKEDLEDALLDGKKEVAEKVIFDYSTVTVGAGVGIDPVHDEDAWDRAYSQHQQALFTWNNKHADRFFGNALARDGLIAILGPEKRGKTFWCVEFAMRALMNRCNVALFEVGDMSESQIMRRLGCRLSKRPMFRKQCGNIQIPKLLTKHGEDIDIESILVNFPYPATAKSSKAAVKKFIRKCGFSSKAQPFMLSIHPNTSINVAGISAILERWEMEKGFVPDVVIIDYPDILDDEPGTGGMTIRDKINTQWKALRRLSQEKHNLVIVPTQADANSYKMGTLDMTNFSEDKRKFAHVTGMMGLNQNSEEKTSGLMRLNWIVLREDEFVSTKCLCVAQCLSLARAFCTAVL